MTLVAGRWTLGRAKMLDFLGSLAEEPGEKILSIYIAPRLPHGDIENLLQEVPAPPDIFNQLLKLAGNSGTGAVIFWSPQVRYLVLPPFPVQEKRSTDRLDTGPLVSLLRRDYLFAMVLVRLGYYAIGVCQGEKLVSSKVGTALVHGRHKKGGSSAHRFERHRDKQIEMFLTRVCQRAREQLELYARSLDYIIYGGARNTILTLQKRCLFLNKLYKPALPPMLDIPQPRQVVLETIISRVWSGTVFEWREY